MVTALDTRAREDDELGILPDENLKERTKPQEEIIRLEVIETPLTNEHIDRDDWNRLLEDIGKSVRDEGHLVVFPTETVYGLGANALDRDAVLRIFEAKQRPLSDPVICHVSSYEDSLRLFNCNPVEHTAIHLLAHVFWPGPLSVVARASSIVPSNVTAGTQFVAVRCPNNTVALELIKAAQVPIAAPSANRFGHISPSTSSHVTKNFPHVTLSNFPSQKRLIVLDGGSCQVGIESTVCKIELVQHAEGTSGDYGHVPGPRPSLQVTVLRRGYVTQRMIHEAIQSGIQGELVKGCSEETLEILRHADVVMSTQIVHMSHNKTCPTRVPNPNHGSDVSVSDQSRVAVDSFSPSVSTDATSNHSSEHGDNTQSQLSQFPLSQSQYRYAVMHDTTLAMPSPGMMLTHYSPSVLTCLCPLLPIPISPSTRLKLPNSQEVQLRQCVIIDAFNQLLHCQGSSLGYFSLSQSTDLSSMSTIRDMTSNVFLQLHNAEDCAIESSAVAILVYDFKAEAQVIGEMGLAVYDRLYRASSGQSACLSS